MKSDLMAMFSNFYAGNLDIYRLNIALLTLITKEPDGFVMKKFRPISLLNCVFKIFTNVLTNRLGLVMNRLISNNRSTFIKGRYILESVITAHELIHSVVKYEDQGVVLKLYYEKALIDQTKILSITFLGLEVLMKDGYNGFGKLLTRGLLGSNSTT